jgi:aflatoxin B1 aldehyde reductase
MYAPVPCKTVCVLLTRGYKVGDSSQDTTVRYSSPEQVNAYLDAFNAYGGREVDTARGYPPHAPGSSEQRLGLVAAGDRFLIDTEVLSFTPGSHAKGKIQESVSTSLGLLKIPAINIEYLHVPDRATPFAETLKATDEAYRAGKFKQLGLSNFTADEVDDIIAICDDKGWCKPSVYQGQYNAIVRSGEAQLFPTLRKHKIAFYAWR